ncbi:hypothetical protein TURU_030803 [Turdus rufiventris]|nr:hypothetical protein TURU_030803 [Turdus rufiventris]
MFLYHVLCLRGMQIGANWIIYHGHGELVKLITEFRNQAGLTLDRPSPLAPLCAITTRARDDEDEMMTGMKMKKVMRMKWMRGMRMEGDDDEKGGEDREENEEDEEGTKMKMRMR